MPSDRCPWSKTPKGEIGEFEINGVKLYVPRNYLLFDKKIPDGDTDGITLLMKYPDMTPAGDDPDSDSYHVMVSIDSPKMWGCCRDENECTELDKRRYKNSSYINTNNEKKIPNKIEKLYDLPLEGLIAYRINDHEELLVRGDPLNPEYWLECVSEKGSTDSSTSCKTTFNYNNKIYVEYYFSREYVLKNHDELRAKVISKINEFQQLSKEP